MNKTYIIAEAGVNHNGSMDNAIKLIDLAKTAKADAIKFQAFNGKALNRRDIIPYELAVDDYYNLYIYANACGLDFLCTCFDTDWLSKLSCLMPYIKIPSSKTLDPEYLTACAVTNKDLILSTGLSSLKEVKYSLDVLMKPYNMITILHCTTAYPCDISYANMSAMSKLSKTYGYDVGFSDHTVGSMCAVMAVALGATMIEKHITLDRNMEGPDHKASADPYMFVQYVRKIREAETAFGNGIKKVERCSMKYEKLKDQYNLSK